MKSLETARAVDLAVGVLRAAILSGEFQAGSRLPAERALSKTLAINRLTLRAAISRLEAEGLLRPRQGDGVWVLDFKRSAGLELVRHLLQSRGLNLVQGFLEMRRAFGAEAVALATKRKTKDQLEKLKTLAALQQEEQNPDLFAKRDLEFGREVLRAARNLPMMLLLNTIERVYLAQPDVIEALHQDREAVRMSYHAVIHLLEQGDPAAARETVRTALELIDQRALARLRRRGWRSKGV